MDTNEEIEATSRVQKLRIQELVPYPESFWYEYSERGMTMQNSPSVSIWKTEGDKTQHGDSYGPQCPGRRSFLDQLDKDTLLHVLSLLDFQSLIRCTSVNWSMNKLIRSPELRRMWSSNQSPVVLISSYTLPCKLWVPGPNSSPTSATLFPPLSRPCVAGAEPHENALVVASHRGLVCIRFETVNLELVVGNPLTQEWMSLPTAENFEELCGYRYTMEVFEEAGDDDLKFNPVHFKVAGISTSDESHSYHVFDSVTGEWSSTSLDFPPGTAFKWSEFDLRTSSWRTELIRKWDIKTGLERTPDEVHSLPHPSLHGFCEWEHNGSTYFASSWIVVQVRDDTSEDSAGEFAGYGVWKVIKDDESRGGSLETIAAVWGQEVGASLDAIRSNVKMQVRSVNCTAAANLVCFGLESLRRPTMPVVVYDIELSRWTGFDEQPRLPDDASPYWPGDHYAAAVVYSPSLVVAPSSFPQKLDTLEKALKKIGADPATELYA